MATESSNTGCHNMIPFNRKYAPYLPNYSAGAGGRTFPSPAGFEIDDMFFTDDILQVLQSRCVPENSRRTYKKLGSWWNNLAGMLGLIAAIAIVLIKHTL